jgi:hemerythrin-like domain-containing protein
MLPIAPLMIEHRLIERRLSLARRQLADLEAGKVDDSLLVDFVAFIRQYADHCHHGKEEDLLFVALDAKPLSNDQARILGELREEHIAGRKLIRELDTARAAYQQGDKEALKQILSHVRQLLDFYPSHIEKEDRNFFLPVMKLFSPAEQEELFRAFWEFDAKLYHEDWTRHVSELEEG